MLISRTRFWPRRRSFRCRRLAGAVPVSARQERIRGWDQRKFGQSSILLVGAGGLGGQIAEGLVQKGAGIIHIADFDIVTPTNLNRQPFCARDLWKHKATCLCRNMAARGFLGTCLVPHPVSFQDLGGSVPWPNLMICGVDNQLPATRLEVSRYCRKDKIPAIIMGATADADAGYVFVQEPGSTCWACLFGKDSVVGEQDRCPETPASVDILKVLGGIALYAADSILMRRPRDWNYWYVSLSKAGFGGASFVRPRLGCPVCGGTVALPPSEARP